MQVRELKNIKNLSSFRLMAGENGLEHIIKDAVIFEYENFSVAPDNYYEGDFVIVTLTFAKDSPELIVPTLLRLMRQRISGMAVKASREEGFWQELIEYAEEAGLPVFLFQDIFIENVIVSIHEYMRSRANFALYEKDFQEMLYGNLPKHYISDRAAVINPGHREKLAVIYLSCKGTSAAELTAGLINLTSKSKSRKYIEAEFCFYQYREGIFILHNLHAADEETNAKKYRSLINRLEVPQSAVVLGISSVHEPNTEFDLCLKESYYACCYAIYRNKSRQQYCDMGIYRFIFPILMEKTGRSYYESLLHQISSHDLKNHTNLLATLTEYVKADCDINRAATQLFQHPNTIRYRIQKLYDLIGGNGQEPAHTLYILALIQDMESSLLVQPDKSIL